MRMERRRILMRRVIEAQGNIKLAARHAGVARSAFYKMLDAAYIVREDLPPYCRVDRKAHEGNEEWEELAA